VEASDVIGGSEGKFVTAGPNIGLNIAGGGPTA
jgi:hypothetical protein